MRFSDLPLSRKLLVIIALATGMGLALGTLLQWSFEVQSSRTRVQSELTGVAGLLAAHATNALRANDAKAAADALAEMHAWPGVRHALLRKSDGSILAAYPPLAPARALAGPVPESPRVSGGFWDDRMLVEHPVRGGDTLLGSVVLDADLGVLWQQLYRNMALALAAAVAAFGLALALAVRMQRAVSTPLHDLVAASAAAGPPSTDTPPVPPSPGDEIAQLTHRFHVLRDELQARDRALAQAEDARLAGHRQLADLHHALEAPMHGLAGSVEMLLATPLSEHQRRMTDTVQVSAESVLHLLESPREEGGLSTPAHAAYNPAQVVEQVALLCAGAAHAKGLDLACEMPDTLPLLVLGDGHGVRQALASLAAQAIAWTARGEVVLGVAATATEGTAAPWLRYTVRHTGAGLDAPAGAGLALCHTLAARMGGRVGHDAPAAGGAALWLEVPATTSPAAPGTSAGRHAAALPGATPVVLAMPESATRRVLSGLFTHLGGAVVEFPSMAALLDGMEQVLAATPGLLVIDASDPAVRDGGAAALRARIDNRQTLVLLTPPPATPARVSDAVDGVLLRPVIRGDVDQLIQRLFDPDKRRAPAPAAVPAGLQLHAHVLLAEDNQVNREIATAMLQAMDCRVTQAHDGAQALRAVQSRDIDLVLMDCQMPVMDGFESTRRIRAWEHEVHGQARLPIVALTANAQAGDREACLAAGMDDYLAKPVTSSRLAETLARHLSRGDPGRTAAAVAPPSLPQTAALPVYDARVLAQLPMVANGTHPRFVQDMQRLFLDSNAQALEDIASTWAAADATVLQRLMHSMKSSSAQVGAVELAAMARDFEHALRAGQPPGPDWPGRLRAAFERLRAVWQAG